MRKIGLIGAGHLGKIHLKLLKEIPEWDLIGFYDSNTEVAKAVADKFAIPFIDSVEDLVNQSDAIDIVTPTLHHSDYAHIALDAGKHIFIEKPLANTIHEAKQIMQKCDELKLIGQVGHVERFNPAYLSVKDKINKPLFIETHRLAEFNPRGTDVSVVLDLMIHDLDILLKCVDDEIVDIQASGVPLISNQADIVNARITFKNSCVANMTASRISMKSMRKMRIFQNSAYISMDFLKKTSEIVKMSDDEPKDQPSIKIENETTRRFITFEIPNSPEINAIKKELESFADSINSGSPVEVPLSDGYKALKLAHQINDLL